MKWLPRSLAAAILALALLSCATRPEPLPPSPPPQTATTTVIPAQTEASTPDKGSSFDPTTVTVAEKKATLFDARALIEKLNAIIAAKDFEAWLAYLTDEYRIFLSDPAQLATYSELTQKKLGIPTRTLKDYFLNVVCLSRKNARLDDIEFIGADRIKALTINAKGESLVLYYLEKKNDTWKIGIGR